MLCVLFQSPGYFKVPIQCYFRLNSGSNSERDNALQLLFRQMQRPHSQIRCSVVKVFKFLTTESLQASLASSIKEAILLHLQVRSHLPRHLNM